MEKSYGYFLVNQTKLEIHGNDTAGLDGRGIGVAVLDTGCFPTKI